MNLNEASEKAFEIARKRGINETAFGALKHCAGEVLEATEASVNYYEIENLADNINATDIDEKWESQEEPDVCEEYYQKSKERFANELADIIICVLSICGAENIDIEKAIERKMKINEERAK